MVRVILTLLRRKQEPFWQPLARDRGESRRNRRRFGVTACAEQSKVMGSRSCMYSLLTAGEEKARGGGKKCAILSCT